MDKTSTTPLTTPAIWFVSRHAGAIEWAKLQQISIDHWVSHIEASAVQSGDTVIGSLPVHLAAEICERGAIYFHLSVSTPAEWRGREMSAAHLQQFNAKLQRFGVVPL